MQTADDSFDVALFSHYSRVFCRIRGRPFGRQSFFISPEGDDTSLSPFGFIDARSLIHKKEQLGRKPRSLIITHSPTVTLLPQPTMLHKLLKLHKLARLSHPDPPKPVYVPDEEASSALKIVHAGGKVECYFMPIPVARIIEKYPSFYVTRPEVFRRPWEAVVGPDETLFLGEKYYLVPRHTVKKLRRRTRRPGRDERSADFTGSRSLSRAAIKRNGGDSSGSFVMRGVESDGSDVSTDFKVLKTKAAAATKHVRFRGIDEKPRKGPSMVEAAAAATTERKHGKVVEGVRKGSKKKNPSGKDSRKVKVNTPTWQPALASISETYGPDE